MHIEPIKTTEKIQEAWNLLEMHREELATYKHLMVLKPNLESYQKLEDAGKLIGLGLYDEDKIVGYSVLILTTALHYSDLIIAQNDLIYIHPDYRKGKWGLKLIYATEEAAREKGIKMILWHGKEKTIFSELMPKLGYIVQDIMFSKEL
jgi:GNAT superfamily N-acetyltransferase